MGQQDKGFLDAETKAAFRGYNVSWQTREVHNP